MELDFRRVVCVWAIFVSRRNRSKGNGFLLKVRKIDIESIEYVILLLVFFSRILIYWKKRKDLIPDIDFFINYSIVDCDVTRVPMGD